MQRGGKKQQEVKPKREKLYTMHEISEMLQVDERTLIEWVLYRKIPYVKLNGQLVRFRLSEINEWIRAFNKPVPDRKQILRKHRLS